MGGIVDAVFGGGNDPPPPPDYTGAAIAQGAANKEAAIASSRLNNPNVINPYGTQTWQEGKTPDARPTVTQTLSPEQKALYDKQMKAQGLLGDLSIQGASALDDVIGRNLDMSVLPAAPGDAAATRSSVIDAMMGRVNEDTDRAISQKNSQLVAAGIMPGTKAYDDAMALIERGRTDARQQAIIAGGTEAQRDYNIDADRRRVALAEMLTGRQTPLNEINSLLSGSQVNNPFAVPNVSSGTNIQPAPMYRAVGDQYNANMGIYNANQASNANLMNGLFSLGSAALGSPFLF